VLRPSLLLSIILLLGVCAACTGTPTPSASGQPGNTAMVLSDPTEPTSLDPLAGYASDGSAKIFQGLLEHQADGTLAPVLAKALPVPSADGRSWTISVATGPKFSDGTPFGVPDVLATYRALLDPVVNSPLRAEYSMLTSVDQVNASTVRFNLAYPYAPFPQLLVLGILPAVALATPVPVSQSPVNTKPVGTGPYLLSSWSKGQDMVLAANPKYTPVPKIKKVTVVFDGSDTDRAAQLRAGKLDGAAVSPAQAATFAKSDAFTVLVDPAADLRAITLPSTGVAADPAVRLALNEAVDRSTLVKGALAGDALAASTPMPSVLPEFVETSATFDYDPTKAASALQAAGWVAQDDGVRARSGQPAALTLDYPTGDSVDEALAKAFVADAAVVGVAVTTAPVPPDQLAAKQATDATLISTGNPFDPDLSLYPLLGASPDPAVADPLNAGRHTLDPGQRSVDYRQFQRAYIANPSLVCLVFVDHEYVMRDDWTGYQQVVDGSTEDVTWGPWWNLDQWIPR
jgi:peptide/nickel transport system substrate-binding protein